MSTIPGNKVPFHLVIDVHDPANIGTGIVKAFICEGPADNAGDGWTYEGDCSIAISEGVFMLVTIEEAMKGRDGPPPKNKSDCRELLEAVYGPSPRAPFMRAFIQEFGGGDMESHIFIADFGWRDVDGQTRYPFLDIAGWPNFGTGDSLPEPDSRWIVPAPKGAIIGQELP